METANQLVLRACMIDGFGPFEEADYRRSWLFFEDVDYIVPHRLSGMTEGMNLDNQLDFQVCREELASDELEQLFELTRRDAEDPELRRLVESCIPRTDRDYAAALVRADVQLRGHKTRPDEIEPVLFLANKLLWFAARRGSVPIVGRDYTAELIAHKLRGLGTTYQGRGLLSSRAGSLLAAFAAGLALDFVSNEQLAATQISRLVDFKHRNRALLAQHQLHLIDVAETFAALPNDADFTARLAQLRLQARRDRLDLDARARDAWLDCGLDLAKKAIGAATAGLVSGLAVLRDHTLNDVLAAALPAAVAAGGVVLSSALDARSKARAKPPVAMAYLLRAADTFGA